MLEVGLVLAFVAYALVSGLRARGNAAAGLSGYFLARRSLGSWRSGLSMTATQFAADTPLLAAGLVATGGVFALWRLWIYGIAFLLLGFLLGAAWWRSGVVTDAELCELRYGGRAARALRVIKALYYGVVFNCAVLAMVGVAAVRIAEPFLRWEQWLPAGLFGPAVRLAELIGVPLAIDPAAADVWVRTAANAISLLLIYAFTLTYSMTGGLRGVVSTDVGQLALALLGSALYAGYAVQAVGGLGQLPQALAEVVGTARAESLLAFDPTRAAGVSGTLLGVLGLQWLVQMNSDGTGYLAQRVMACRSPAQARRAPVLFAFAQVLLRSLLWLPILLALLVLFPLEASPDAAAREQTFVLGIQTLLPPGARAVVLVGLLAALASTLDTHLNWGASYIANDLYPRWVAWTRPGHSPGARELVRVARLSNPLLACIALLIMTQLDSIQAAWHATLLLGAGLGIPLLLRWVWRRANASGELAAILASAISAPLLLASVDSEGARLLGIAAIGTLASVGTSLLTAPEHEARLDEFYRRCQPPGFWGTAEARRRLGSALIATAAAAGSLFAALVGLGSWLVGGTPPVFLPDRTAWITLNLLVALVLVPVWASALRERS